jgi:Domain of unknown function (DUF5615)
MRISLYLDEDSHSSSLIHALRYRGLDVSTAREAQMLGSTDLEQLYWATAQGRVLYSFNIRDFFRLHSDYLAQGKSHAGMVLAQQQLYSIGEQMRRLLKLVAVKSAEEMIDQVEFLSGWG